MAFPLVLVPQVGLVRSGLLFGLLNAAVALWTVRLFAKDLPARHGLHAQCGVALALLVAGLGGAERLSALAEQNIYADTIVYAKSTPYQRMVLTRWKDDLRLFLNGNLQFSSQDEYRYHEALVHPGMASVRARRVLVLGGGDGLALRELLKYPELESIQLVDLDAEMTRLFSTAPFLRRLNGDAFASPKVKVANEDALLWLERTAETFDFIVVDFPDPSNFAVGKLYTTAFYRLLEKHLSSQGLAVIQATSPYYARQSYWCVVATLEEAGLATTPYHAMVPSFGEWGYILAGRRPVTPPTAYAVATRFLTADSAPQLFQFPKDMQRVPAEPNRLNNQVLVRYFEEEWRRVLH
ncbi:polyamine aminopropyltransferase [Methylogaea oryzae]|uniref:polyamine aminopropyltransferase n=1 Tax=Methylogaea oryzae TaxID=1295382 RepID=UPI000B08DFAE|nr:polyamine aminopropyltransferase [Methylogaea oryzae]